MSAAARQATGSRAHRPAFRRDQRGTSAVEFALLLPVFSLILVGVIDFGGVLYKRFRLDAAVSAGANYALLNAAKVGSANGASLASSIANLLALGNTAQTTSGAVVVNNGPTATVAGGVTTASGTASAADSCYCPTLSGATVSWGSAQTCGAACSGGGIAGKFVAISAQQTYTSSFSDYGIVSNGTITARAVIQAQ